jgi:hypothetical protein
MTRCAAATWPMSRSAGDGSSPASTCSNSSASPPSRPTAARTRQLIQAWRGHGVTLAEKVQARGKLGHLGGLAPAACQRTPGCSRPRPGGESARPGSARTGRSRTYPISAGQSRRLEREPVVLANVGRSQRHPPTVRETAVPGVAGHTGFSTRFSGIRRLGEVEIGACPGGCLRIVRFTTRRARAGRGPWRRRVRAPVRRGAGLVWREYGRPAEELGGGLAGRQGL